MLCYNVNERERERECFIGIYSQEAKSNGFRPDKNTTPEFIEQLQKHSTKSVSLGSPYKGSNCEGKILACKKSKLCLIIILYIKNINEECFMGG